MKLFYQLRRKKSCSVKAGVTLHCVEPILCVMHLGTHPRILTSVAPWANTEINKGIDLGSFSGIIFLYPGTKREIQTLQGPKAKCRWAHHLRLGFRPWVSEITASCFPSFAMQNPSLRRGRMCCCCPFRSLSVLFAVHLRFFQFTPPIAILCLALCFPKQTFGRRIEIAALSILCSKSEYSQQMPRCNKSN